MTATKVKRANSNIAYAKIFPPIGIARVGDSESEFFYGPEFARSSARPEDHRFRDAKGCIKRQAARFRIYGFNASGEAVQEITAAHADITWTAHLANKKAAWFDFDGAAAARRQFANAPNEESISTLRNVDVGAIERDPDTGRFRSCDGREALEIDGCARSIAGVNIGSSGSSADERYRFDGAFKRGLIGVHGHAVYLGELRTDDAGRLIVLGGHGISRPVGPTGPIDGDDRLDYWIVHYANNNDWCDDTSDGPVTAQVVMKDGMSIPVEGGAWVVVAPPDFAPDVTNLVTLYDVMEEIAIAARMKHAPGCPTLRGLDAVNFSQDIEPILTRANEYRWVSPLGLRGHGLGKPGDAGGRTGRTLQMVGEEGRQQRERFVSVVRVPNYPALDPTTGAEGSVDDTLAVAQANSFFMPPLSGDEGGRAPGQPQNWFTLTRLQYERLKIWRDANDGLDQELTHARTTLADELTLLTKNAMDACSGGAFFPGIEMTAVVRDPSLYVEPFRIDHGRVGPGDMTKFMACPWQADFYECRDDWWPAQRPDSVITDLTFEELFASFKSERGSMESLMFRRERWDRGLERKPRPSRDYLVAKLLPPPATDDADAYAGGVAGIATDVLFSLAPGGRYQRHSRRPLAAGTDAERLPSPWRLQYLVQEQLDGYSGRYFLPTVPAPEEVLRPAEVPPTFNPPTQLPTLESLRHDWATLRIRHPAYAGFLLGAYATAAEAALQVYLKKVVLETPAPKDAKPEEVPATGSGKVRFNLENASDEPSTEPHEFEADSVSFKRLRGGEFVTQVVSGMFLSSCDQAPDMAMVDQWRSLGFVRTRTIPATKDTPPITIQLETERSKYDGKSYRDYFYYLMNISEFPDFGPFAKTIATDILDSAQKLIDQTSIFDPTHPESFVVYSPANFAGKMEQIYELLRAQANRKPSYAYRNTRQERIQALTGNAPFNQTDGAWLRFAANAGTIDEITSLLFGVWGDEVGNGDPSLHHGNLYTTLLKSLGVYLPDVTSRAYVDDPRFDESTFVGPVFELAVSQHTQEFFPEILGMTLYLEWEVLTLVPGAKRLDYFGIDSQFWRLHVGIDNATEGHGAMAKRAVELYLDKILRESGATAQQDHWKRIWRGFVAFATAGYDLFVNVGPTLADGMSVESEKAIHTITPAEKVAALIERKAPYGNLNHVRAKLGAYRINDLFDDPRVFMEELANSPVVTPGSPDESRFLTYLTTFQGPMYKVFSDEDILVWREWIEWLGRAGNTNRPKSHINRAQAMQMVLADLRSLMIASHGHQLYRVPTVKDGQGHLLELAELFKSGDIKHVMSVLKDPQNGWVVPFRPADSVLIVDLMRPGKPMGAALDRRQPELFGQVARMVVYEWIAAGCPIPDAPPPDAAKAIATKPREPRLFVQQYGMGAVH